MIAKLISNILGRQIKIKYDDSRARPIKSEVSRLLASNKKAKKLLNWRPKYSNRDGLISALTETINWYDNKENLKNFRSNYTL